MLLKFQTKTADKTGNKKQMLINTELKRVLHGYFVFEEFEAITISNKDYEKLHGELLKNGFDFKVAR